MSTSLLSKFVRVSEANPCPICDHTDWCMVAADGKQAICPRTESNTLWGAAGYLHDVDEDAVVAPEVVIPERLSHYEIQELVDQWYRAIGEHIGHGQWLIGDLGVSAESLDKLRVGWAGHGYSFPMRDGNGEYTGVRFRGLDGRKWSLRGGREGLFMPSPIQLHDGPLFICEGASDTAAMLTLGFNAIGRPNCSGGYEDIKLFLGDSVWPKIVIVSDNDAPGIKGAKQLANRLTLEGGRVTIIRPHYAKDAREAVQQNTCTSAIMEVVEGGFNNHWTRL